MVMLVVVVMVVIIRYWCGSCMFIVWCVVGFF